MATVDCTINDLLVKLNEWIPIWCGEIGSNIGDTVAIPVEYKWIYGITRYNAAGDLYANGPCRTLESSLNFTEQRLDYVNTVYGCKIYKIVGVDSYTDNFMMLFGKLTDDPNTKNLYYKFLDTLLSLFSKKREVIING